MDKKWNEAGKAFVEAANLHAKAGSKHDAATNFVDAANCYKKADANGLFILNFIMTLKLYIF
jgi:alpha-soluble NSF attachment protein